MPRVHVNRYNVTLASARININRPLSKYRVAINHGCGVGVEVGVALSRGNESGVGVGADQAALTPTPELLLKFVASLAQWPMQS